MQQKMRQHTEIISRRFTLNSPYAVNAVRIQNFFLAHQQCLGHLLQTRIIPIVTYKTANNIAIIEDFTSYENPAQMQRKFRFIRIPILSFPQQNIAFRGTLRTTYKPSLRRQKSHRDATIGAQFHKSRTRTNISEGDNLFNVMYRDSKNLILIHRYDDI